MANKYFDDTVDGFFTWPTFYKDMINRFPTDSSFVEIGLFKGKSFAYLLREMLNAGKRFNLTGVDYFMDVGEGALEKFNINLQPYNGMYNLIIGFSIEVAKGFKNKSLDFVFIDASHDYESVRDDIKAWLPKIKKGGVLSGHDYLEFPGVRTAVDEAFSNNLVLDYTFENCWMVNIQ
jgi:predicted O-methyltransferase YrrM